MSVYLSGSRYVLGEEVADHTTIADLDARAAAFGLVPKAEFWGWGTIRRTARDVTDLAVQTATQTLAAAMVDPVEVDCLVLCSTRFPADVRDHGAFAGAVLTGAGLIGADVVGIGLSRCANLLAGIRTGQALVASGQHRRVLVVTTDRIVDEADRLEKFAMFSDGAASCLLGDSDPDGRDYEVVASASAHDARQLGWDNELSAELSQRVNTSLLKSRGLAVADIAGVMHGNIFKPVVVLKELQAGFRLDQLYTDNIARIGHCFAADPIINLADRATAGEVRPGGYYLLASSVQGSRIGVLLRAGGDP